MMDLNKLLERLSELLDPAIEKRKKYRKKLKLILRELKTKEAALRQKLEATYNERKRDRLQKELDIVYSQRMKGINALRSKNTVENCEGEKSE